MNVSYKTLLTLSCVSFSLHAMEEQPKALSSASSSAIQPVTQKIDYSSLIQKLYNKAHSSLENYSPTALQSLKDILEINTQIKELKLKGIEAQEYGKFAYEQPFHAPLFWDKETPYHNPFYTSVLLKRIADYSNRIQKDNLSIPTVEQFSRYMSNIKNKAAIEQATTDFGLEIDLNEIDPTKNRVIVDLSQEIIEGAQALDTLIENIVNIKKAMPHDIQRLAYILYGCKL